MVGWGVSSTRCFITFGNVIGFILGGCIGIKIMPLFDFLLRYTKGTITGGRVGSTRCITGNNGITTIPTHRMNFLVLFPSTDLSFNSIIFLI